MTNVLRRYGPRSRPFSRPAGEVDGAFAAPVVLMVSGGADSTALLLLAATSALDIADGRGEAPIARERLHVLHVNHGTRGLDSREDEEFVREVAGRFGIPVTVVAEDVRSLANESPGHSFEEVAREVRYHAASALLDALCDERGVRHKDGRILVAHTADDRVETFFMNAIRGAGPAGLSSIPRRRNRIVRPLLDRSHRELCDLLRMRGLVWREDVTNADPAYLRNYVRRSIVVAAEAKNPRLAEAIVTSCDLLADEDAYLTGVAAQALRDCRVSQSVGLEVLGTAALTALDVAVARRVVRQALLAVEPAARLEARHIARVLEAVARGHGSVATPLGVTVSVDPETTVVRARDDGTVAPFGWLGVPGTMALGRLGTLEARIRSARALGDPVAAARAFGLEHAGRAVMLDADALGIDAGHTELWVGLAEQGERMRPLGLGGVSKRVTEVIAAAGVPKVLRPTVPVVRTGPKGRIAWVCGVRADERFRVTAATQSLVVLRLRGTS